MLVRLVNYRWVQKYIEYKLCKNHIYKVLTKLIFISRPRRQKDANISENPINKYQTLEMIKLKWQLPKMSEIRKPLFAANKSSRHRVPKSNNIGKLGYTKLKYLEF